MLDFDSPDFFTIDARDQCVALAGTAPRSPLITSSTFSNRIQGGRPGGARSRACHLFTVFGDTRRSTATCLFARTWHLTWAKITTVEMSGRVFWGL
jgi:hypothetical protein